MSYIMYFYFFIISLIKKNTGGVENTGAIKGAIISSMLNILLII